MSALFGCHRVAAIPEWLPPRVEGEDVGVLRVFLVLDVQLHRQSRSRMSLERSERVGWVRGKRGQGEKGRGILQGA